MKQFKKALNIATKAHKGQLRKGSNTPYIVHPIRVSLKFANDVERTIAVLHDVLEDTELTKEYLSKHFTSFVVETVDLLSRKKEDKYFDYIKKIVHNKTARMIKIADIIDNLSDNSCDIEESMMNRYIKSLELLI